MKKFRGTKFAKIGTSYTTRLDAEIDRVEAMVLNKQARINELSLRVQRLIGLDPDEAFEQLLTDNEDVLVRLKTKDTYTVEDFWVSWGK